MGEELPICVACGTQYDAGHGHVPFECKICEVQYVHDHLCIIIALISKNPGSTSICAIHWTAMDQPIKSGREALEQVGAKPVQSQHMVYMDRTKSTLVKGAHRPFVNGLGQFAIGQRAMLLRTPRGNVLWDLVSLVDGPLVNFVCTFSSHSSSCDTNLI